jgi:hypothetical protein
MTNRLDRIAQARFGRDWNDLTGDQRYTLIITCVHETSAQGRRFCPIKGKIDPKCSLACSEHVSLVEEREES